MTAVPQPWADQPWSRPVIVYSQPRDRARFVARATVYLRLPDGGTASRSCDLVDAAVDDPVTRTAIEHLLAAELRHDVDQVLGDSELPGA